MRQMNVVQRLLIGCIVVVALGAIAMQSFARLSDATAAEWRHAEQRSAWAFQISQLRENVATQRAEQLAMLTAPEAQQTILETSIRQRSQDISRIISDFHAAGSQYPAMADQLNQLSSLHGTVRRRENLQILPGLREGQATQARAMLLGVQQTDFNKLQDVVKGLAENLEQNSMSEAAAATSTTKAAQSMALSIAIFSTVAAAIVMAFLLLTTPKPAPARS